MQPIAIEADPRRHWMIVHQCQACGAIHRNRAALDDENQPDDFDEMLRVAQTG